ncbi:MAG TPA: Gp138 family membrane-puncturing spike protein [Methylophilaceae bacterium]
MDRRERAPEPEEVIRLALDARFAQAWTAMPGIIQSFNPQAMTCEVQPAINGWQRNQDGTFSPLQMPLLLDCPVFFPSGGGATLTFPIKPGDECLVVFASRCIDAWWQLGGIQSQPDLRMHDLSDGFVFAGVRSQPRRFTVDTDAAQLRSDDGQAYIELNPTTHDIKVMTPANVAANVGGNVSATVGGDITAEAAGEITLKAQKITLNTDEVHITGDLNIDGTTIGNGVNLNTHVHINVEPGPGTSGPPQV